MVNPATFLSVPNSSVAGLANNVQGSASKGEGETLRFAMDFGNEPLLIAGATITAQTVTCPDPGGPTVSGVQLDAAYQVSAKVSGGSAGNNYNLVYTITLDDADTSVIVRTAALSVT